jgi:hypothetical protein
MSASIDEIFNMVINHDNPTPKSFPLGFELDNLKELFEFLLQFVTMLCKHFYADDNGQVDLNQLSPENFKTIETYMQFIGFTCNFEAMPANSTNLNWAQITRYDRIEITNQTKLEELHLGLKCNTTLFVISFKSL